MELNEALQHDAVRHDVNSDEDGGGHRLVVNGEPGPWASAHAIARNGLYCATTPRFEEFFGHGLPRVFVAIGLSFHPDKQLRQPSQRADPRSAGDTVVSSPDPGDEEGIETAPPSDRSPLSSAPDGGAVPRLYPSHAPKRITCTHCDGRGQVVVTPDAGPDEIVTCPGCSGSGLRR